VRLAMVQDIVTECQAAAQRRNVSFTIEPFMESPATPMDKDLIGRLEETVRSLGIEPLHLSSGAGHDAVAMANLCPSAMLFVRCKDGISHNPAESITTEDADVAARVLIDAVKRIAA
jgi:allantoate deiminase